jgi:hypothetical protein
MMAFSKVVFRAFAALAVAPLCRNLISIGMADAQQVQYDLKHDFGSAAITGIHHAGDGSGRLFVVTKDVSVNCYP